MKDLTARVLAIIALVFIGIFTVALVITLVDYTILNYSIGFIALGSGVFAFVIFLALRADGRGFSMTKINNDIEMEKLEKQLAEQEEREKAEAEAKKAAEQGENLAGAAEAPSDKASDGTE